MALLSAEEKAKLGREGVWGAKEKCDECGDPLLMGISFIRKGQTMCKGCYDAGKRISGHGKKATQIKSNLKEENVMATKQNKKEVVESTKVGGFLIAGSALADMYEVLEDEKKHGFAELKKICAKHKKDLVGRLGNLRRVGEKKKSWGLIVDKEGSTVQMKLGAAPKSAPAPKVKAKEVVAPKASAKTSKKSEPEDDSSSSSKTLKAVATLVRRTLKSGKDWTKNKLIENMVDEHDMDPKVVKEALNSEIKAGGITVKDGILALA